MRSPFVSSPDFGGTGTPPPHPTKPRLLVADDDALTRDLLNKLLTDAGYDVEPAVDGQEAVDRVAKGGIDLALLDVVMPRMSGLEACRIIKAMTRETFVAAILMAPKTDPTSRIEGLNVGADDYVSKPFERSELLARVQGSLRIKRLYDQMRAARARLEKVSVRDELTGLYNYRYLPQRLKDAFQHAERHHDPLACCLFDVDRLKLYNERAGRSFGDGVLRVVGDVLRASTREADAVVRYGPDEFLLLLPSTHFVGAVQVCERIWRGVGERMWPSPAGATTVSLSVGIALFPSRDVRGKEDLLKCADLALTRAKRDGMNRVCVFQQHGLVYTPHASAERGAEDWEPIPPVRGA